eukprot:TRINITY_DN19501_c0_g1_i1.p1 TRINITY_DN19501_c0_g1~~TRINITY_DN19501_c0_g1_i1.p1  ORF type:complete len:923 (+),score=386.68 TRINITY_DN19501_c0_g1_i1:75-2843(+)
MAAEGMNPMVAAVLDNLQRGYEERVAQVARGLQHAVEGLRGDPVLRQLAADSDSALHITAHVEDIVRSALGRESERTMKKVLHRAAHAEARCVLMEATMNDMKQQLHHARQRGEELAKEARRTHPTVDALLTHAAEQSLLASPRAAEDAERIERERRADREELARARDEVHRLRSAFDAQEREVAALHTKRQKLKEALRKAKERDHATDDDAAALREEVRWLTEERVQMSEQYSRLATKLELLAATKEHRNEGLRGKLTDVTQQHNAMLNSYAGMKEETAALREELREQQALVAAREQSIMSLQQEAAGRAAEQQKAETTIAVLQKDVESAEKELRQQADRVREYEMSRLVEERLRPVLESTEKQRREDDSMQLSMKQDQFNAVVGTCKATIEGLERRNDELTKQIEQVTEQAKADLMEMSTHLKAAGEQRQKAECATAEAKTRCGELEKQLELTRQQAESAVENRLLKEEAERLRLALKDREEADRHRAGRASPDSIDAVLHSAVHEQQLHAQHPQQHHQTQMPGGSARHGFGLEAAAAEADLAECRRQVVQLEAKVKALQEERAAVGRDQDAAHQQLQELQRQLARADERTGEARNEAMRLQAVAATLEAAVASERGYKLEAQKQLDEVMNETAAAEAAEAVDYTKWMQEHQELVQLRVKAARVAQLEGDLKKARAEATRLAAEVEALEREKSAAVHQQEITDMRKKNQLDRERQEVERLRQQLAEAQSERDAALHQASRQDLNKSVEERQNQKEMQKFVYYFQKELQKELTTAKEQQRDATEELHAAQREIHRLRSRESSPQRAGRLDDTGGTTLSTAPSIRVELREAVRETSLASTPSDATATESDYNTRPSRRPRAAAPPSSATVLRVGDLGLQHMQQAVASIAAAANASPASSAVPSEPVRRTSSAASSKGAFIRT